MRALDEKHSKRGDEGQAMVRSLYRIPGLVAAGYVVVVAVVWAVQRGLIYQPPPTATPAIAGARLIRTTTSGGLPVVAVYLPASAGHMTVVHFHGNADQLADADILARQFNALGLGFYGVEYPGYGLAAGASPTEESLYAVAAAALGHLHDTLHVPVAEVLLEGHSLGSGVAAEMAVRGHGARLVLISPYTSMMDMAARVMPFLPSRWLVRDRFDTLGKRAQLTLPVLIIHGRLDEVIPLEMGRTLGNAIAGATLAIDDQGGHNDLFAGTAFTTCVDRFSRGEPCDLSRR